MGGHVCKSRGNRQGKLFVQLDFRWKCLIVPPCDLVISSSEYDQSASKLLVSTLLSSRDSNCVFQIKSRFLYYKTKGCWTQARDSKNVEFWGLFWKERNKDTGKLVLIPFALTSFSVTPEIERYFVYYWLWPSISRELSLFGTFLTTTLWFPWTSAEQEVCSVKCRLENVHCNNDQGIRNFELWTY